MVNQLETAKRYLKIRGIYALDAKSKDAPSLNREVDWAKHARNAQKCEAAMRKAQSYTEEEVNQDA